VAKREIIRMVRSDRARALSVAAAVRRVDETVAAWIRGS
jgi:hypothetical protein